MAKQLNITQYRELEEKLHKTLHKNLSILALNYDISSEFQKHFKQGMFAKSNPNAFLHVIHFLLNIIDPVGFKNNFQWPLFDKGMETNFKTVLRTYLPDLNKKFPHANLPPIKVSYMVTPGGFQFTKMILKLSELGMTEFSQKICLSVFLPKYGNSEGQNLSSSSLSESDKAILLNLTEKCERRIKAIIPWRDELYKETDEEAKLIKEKMRYIEHKILEQKAKWKKYISSIPNLSQVERDMLLDNPDSVISKLKSQLSLQLRKVEHLSNILSEKATLYTEINEMSNTLLARSDKGHCLQYNNELKDGMVLQKYVAVKDIPTVDQIVEKGALNLPILLHCLTSAFEEMAPIMPHTQSDREALCSIDEHAQILHETFAQIKSLEEEVIELKDQLEKSLVEARENFEKKPKTDFPLLSLTSFWPAPSPYRNLKWFNTNQTVSNLKEARTISMIDLSRTSNNSTRCYQPNWFGPSVMTTRKLKQNTLEKSNQRYKSTPCLSSPVCKKNLASALEFNSTNDETCGYENSSLTLNCTELNNKTKEPSILNKPTMIKIIEVPILQEPTSTTYEQMLLKKSIGDKYVTPQRPTRKSNVDSNLKSIGKRLSYSANEMPVPNLSTHNKSPCSNSALCSPLGYKPPEIPVCKLISLNNTAVDEELDLCCTLPKDNQLENVKAHKRLSSRFSLGPLLKDCSERLLNISDLEFNLSIDSD